MTTYTKIKHFLFVHNIMLKKEFLFGLSDPLQGESLGWNH